MRSYGTVSDAAGNFRKLAAQLLMKSTPMFKSLRRISILALTAAGIASSAQAQSSWTISRPGSYKLYANHQVATGDGIVITSPNVTLDLNGFQVSTAARGTGRGIVMDHVKGVSVKNGRVSGFNANVAVLNTESAIISQLQILGDNLAPVGGPTEIGILLVNSRGCLVSENVITATNLGLFVRGGGSSGNRLTKNVLTGGAIAGRNLLGICYNPAPTPAGGTANPAGPRGDSIYNNHITRFGFAVAVSTGSVSNVFTDNILAGFTGPFREPTAFTAQGGTNVEADNSAVIIPTTDL